MAQSHPDPDDELLELPDDPLADDESVGVEDAEELMFQELDLGSEEVGLDTETVGSTDTFLGLVDDDEAEGDLLDDSTISVEADIDAGEEEHGWLEESDGSESAGDWEDPLPDDLGEQMGDDGGEEGVDDPLLDGLPEDVPRPRRLDDEDDAEGFEDDGLDEFARELHRDPAASELAGCLKQP